MTGMAISNQRVGGALGRAAAALLLVAAGLAAGIGIAQLGGLGGSADQAMTNGAAQVAADAGWQALRAGERQATVPLSRNTGYQVFRAGERAASVPLSSNTGYQDFRSGERQSTP